VSLGRAVRARLRHHLLDRRLERIDAVARELEELRRERAEVARQIPTWDRVYVFDDTPDEDRLRKIDLALEPRVKVLRELREEVTKDLEKIGEDFPPFGIGVSIERAFRLAAGELRPGPTWAADKETLSQLLSGIADRVAESWVPDFTPAALLNELGDVERCRRTAAASPGPLPTHARLGVAPLSQAALAPLVAKRLLEGEFFAAQEEQQSAQQAYEAAARAAAEASTRIPLLERLNVFSEGPAQIALSERQEELTKAEEALRRAFERSQALLHDALGGYPPLSIHQRALEARGVAELLRVERVPTLSPDGRRRDEEVVVPRALVVAALRRLIHAFAEAFPGVPLPLSLAQERSAIGAHRRSPREHLERAVFTALEEGWALDLRERALEHAALLGMTTRELASQQAPGGWLGRLGTASSESLEGRRAWHEVAATDCWRHVLLHTRRQCETLAPLAARDLVLRASGALTEVRTEVGEFTSPRACPLQGLPAVRSALSAVERALGSHYDLSGAPFELLREIATAAPGQSEEIPSEPFEPLSRLQLVARLAGWFPSGLADRLAPLGQVEDEEWLTAIDSESPEVGERTQELRALATELDLALQAAYPPARLYFELARVVRRVNAIQTECAPRRVEINGQLETRYGCELVNQGPAVEAMEALGRLLHETYGELPDAHELLLAWERSAVVESSWLAE
jgi:hypothetical protein